MCTVTFIARRQGYVLGMNRDEKLARVQARVPRRHRLDGGEALYPSEPNGGTWVGVNEHGATLALINWYSVPGRVTGMVIGRGQVVKQALAFRSAAQVQNALLGISLSRVNPFRLIGVFPDTRQVLEWQWNLEQLQPLVHGWQTHTWISSGADEARAQQTRGRNFHEALKQRTAESVGWLRRLHRSHQPERGPFSTCMHREDAATVSYTEVSVARGAVMRYAPGAPCCTALRPGVRLALRRGTAPPSAEGRF